MRKPTAQSAVEMPGRGKRGKPNPGFPSVSPRPWKSQLRFPHSHRADGSLLFPNRKTTQRSPTLRPPDLQSFRLIDGLEMLRYVGALKLASVPGDQPDLPTTSE